MSSNRLVGTIPYSISGLAHLEQLNLAHNYMSGNVPEGVCILPKLENFTYSYNFFCEEEGVCRNLTSKGVAFDDRRNCLPEKPLQRTKEQCNPVIEHPVDCYNNQCGAPSGGGGGAAPPVALAPARSHPGAGGGAAPVVLAPAPSHA